MEQVKKPFYKKWWVWGIVFIVLVGIGSSSDSQEKVAQTTKAETPTEESKPIEAIKVTAEKIVSDYKANQVAADAKYEGKLIEVSGIVDSIGKDILDAPYITLTTYEYAIIDHVQCMFSRSQEAELAAVSKGQNITLRGTVSGKLGNIIVRGCTIVK